MGSRRVCGERLRVGELGGVERAAEGDVVVGEDGEGVEEVVLVGGVEGDD